MTKPRLHKKVGYWFCSCPGCLGPVGLGRTPKEAFDDWRNHG